MIDYICFVIIQTEAILDQKIRKYASISLEAAIHGLEIFQSKYYILPLHAIFQHRNLGMSFFRSLRWNFPKSPLFFPQEIFKTVLLILNMIEIHLKYQKNPSESKMWKLLQKMWKLLQGFTIAMLHYGESPGKTLIFQTNGNPHQNKVLPLLHTPCQGPQDPPHTIPIAQISNFHWLKATYMNKQIDLKSWPSICDQIFLEYVCVLSAWGFQM